MPIYTAWSLTVLTTVLILWLAKGVLVPLLLATLLAFLLAPIVRRLEKYLPTSVASAVAMLGFSGLIVALMSLLSSQLAALDAFIPQVKVRSEELLLSWEQYIKLHFGMGHGRQLNLLNQGLEKAFSAGGEVALTAVTFTVATLASVALIAILTFLMLYFRRHFRRQLRLLAARQHWATFGGVLESVALLGQSYVAGLVIVIAIVAVLDTAGFLVMGAPFPFLFGTLGGLAVLVPYIGIAVVGPICIAFTLMATGSWPLTGGVMAVFAVVHFLEGNVFSPFLVGSKVNLNPLATILAIVVGGELWGPAGMLLFIPLVGIVKLTLDALPGAEPLAKLLGPISLEDLSPRWRYRPQLGALVPRRRKGVQPSASTARYQPTK